MYLKVIRDSKNKEIQRLYFYESTYNADKKKNVYRMIEPLGSLSELQKIYPDPIAHFKEVAKQRTEETKKATSTNISIDLDEALDINEHNLYNVGYGVLKELYKELELDKFWNWKLKGRKFEYSTDDIFRLLCFSRVLFPGSKKETYEKRGQFFEKFEGFDLDDVYSCLDIIAENMEDLQKWIYSHSKNLVTRDLSTTYFDCTNYYYDIGCPDLDVLGSDGNPIDSDGNPTAPKYRKRGPEKNHRPDPIVEMGLLMDKNGIPIAFELFPGNESEKLHLRPILNRVKNEYSTSRTIVVADRGLNTSDNIYFINGDNRGEKNERDGYLYGQSVRGASEEFKEWVLQGGYKTERLSDDYILDNDDVESNSKVVFKHKSRIAAREINVNYYNEKKGKPSKKKVTIDQKQMVYYSEKYAKKQKHDRNVMIERAKDLIAHPKKYDRVTAAGSASYVMGISFNKNTGEIVEGRELLLDEEKIKEEEKYDGYYSIVTSELKMTDLEMRNTYRGLAKIEDTFKISKSEFEARPVYVWTNDHIDAHFTTCFVALVLIRILQAKLGAEYSVGKILDALRNYSCVQIDENLYQFIYYDEIIKKCSEIFDVNLRQKYRTRDEIRRLLRY